jgi:putative endonuclease
MLVYYEFHETIDFAIVRETRIKKWKRAWKVRLIHSMNPEWIDLFDGYNGAIKLSPVDLLRRAE